MWNKRTGPGPGNSWGMGAGGSGIGGAHQRPLSRGVGTVAELFLPCLKREQKWREGSHWRKRYEVPRTAYERLCAPGILHCKERRQLRERYENLGPFELKDQLEQKLKGILKLKSI